MNDILAANRKEPPGVMPTLEKGMEYIQALWLDIDRRHPGEFKHPLAPIVDVCYEIYNVREITREYERTHTVAVMKHPRGNIPHVSDLPPTNAMPQPQSMEQLVIDFLDPNPTFPPNLLSLIKVHDNGITRTKGGAVSHAFRLAIEGLMMLEPGMTERKYFMTLGEVIDNLQSRFYRGNEDEDTPPKRSDIFHRTNQMPYILDALNILDDHLTIPFRHIDGQIYDSWLPVKIRTRIEQDTSYNAPVFFEVSLPPDATQGYAIFKPYVRYLGFLSLPKLYAYSAYCSLMDKLGTRNGGMIRSTKPDGTICPKTGGIIDPRTNQLVRNENGKIVKNLYDSAAVKQLDRVPNPEAERCYSTIVLKHELIQECHLGEQNLPTWRKWQLAQKHWEWLKDEGYVDFEIHPTGYRFYPTDDLANQYHGVKIAAEAARKARKGKS